MQSTAGYMIDSLNVYRKWSWNHLQPSSPSFWLACLYEGLCCILFYSMNRIQSKSTNAKRVSPNKGATCKSAIQRISG